MFWQVMYMLVYLFENNLHHLKRVAIIALQKFICIPSFSEISQR